MTRGLHTRCADILCRSGREQSQVVVKQLLRLERNQILVPLCYSTRPSHAPRCLIRHEQVGELVDWELAEGCSITDCLQDPAGHTH